MRSLVKYFSIYQDYAINLAKQMKPLNQAKKKEVGRYIDPKILDHMSDEQIIQLYELHQAAANVDDSGQSDSK